MRKIKKYLRNKNSTLKKAYKKKKSLKIFTVDLSQPKIFPTQKPFDTVFCYHIANLALNFYHQNYFCIFFLWKMLLIISQRHQKNI